MPRAVRRIVQMGRISSGRDTVIGNRRGYRRTISASKQLVRWVLPLMLPFVTACGWFSFGPLKPLHFPPKDESHWEVKDIFLTAGSAYARKEVFDHNINEAVSLFFIPKNEKNHYVAETRWFDPSGQEYRTIRQTYDVQQEHKIGAERKKEGTTRVHSMSTKELVNHKPGAWKVALYLDGSLVRRLDFTVR